MNGAAYTFKVTDTFCCTVKANATGRMIQHSVEPKVLVGQYCIRIAFTTKVPGSYSVEMKINDTIVGERATKTYIAGM